MKKKCQLAQAMGHDSAGNSQPQIHSWYHEGMLATGTGEGESIWVMVMVPKSGNSAHPFLSHVGTSASTTLLVAISRQTHGDPCTEV